MKLIVCQSVPIEFLRSFFYLTDVNEVTSLKSIALRAMFSLCFLQFILTREFWPLTKLRRRFVTALEFIGNFVCRLCMQIEISSFGFFGDKNLKHALYIG